MKVFGKTVGPAKPAAGHLPDGLIRSVWHTLPQWFPPGSPPIPSFLPCFLPSSKGVLVPNSRTVLARTLLQHAPAGSFCLRRPATSSNNTCSPMALTATGSTCRSLCAPTLHLTSQSLTTLPGSRAAWLLTYSSGKPSPLSCIHGSTTLNLHAARTAAPWLVCHCYFMP